MHKALTQALRVYKMKRKFLDIKMTCNLEETDEINGDFSINQRLVFRA